MRWNPVAVNNVLQCDKHGFPLLRKGESGGRILFERLDPFRQPTMKMLSEQLGGLSLASTSRAIDGLVKRGLVLRVEDAHDRRARRVSLTAEGRDMADRVLAARLEGLGRFAATLSGPERRKLEAALDLLIQRDDIADVYRNYRKGVHR